MNLRSYTLGLFPVAVALVMGLGNGKAQAQSAANAQTQTSYEFTATYDTLATIDPSYRPDLGIGRTTVTGTSTDAPYGLTDFISNTYNQFDPTTNVSTFNANPAAFGLQGEPILSDRYYGGSNELFGTASDRAAFDFQQGTVSGGGTITITGGTGIFENASGAITFTQNDRLTSTNLTEPFAGRATLNFSVQTAQAVPEPSTNATLVGIGVISTGLLLRRLRRSASI